MIDEYGDDTGRALHRKFGDAFPAAYTDETRPADAIADIACLQHLPERPNLGIRLTRHEMPVGLDLVLIPRSRDEPALDDLKSSLPRLVKQLARKLALEAETP